MTLDLTVSFWTVLRLLVVAGLCILVLRAGRLAVTLAPIVPAQRKQVRQAFPLVELLISAAYLVWAVQQLVRTEPTLRAVAVLGVVFGALWLARSALLDVVSGVLLRAGGSLTVGDRVQLGEIEGRVAWLGNRVLAIETRTGDEVIIPYAQLTGQAVVRTHTADGAHRHVFRLGGIGTDSDSADQVRQLSLLCHWSSVARMPVIEPHEDGGLSVTVFALGAEYGPEIEAFVRKALGPSGPEPRTAPPTPTAGRPADR